jgi:DNA-binding LytR/AlgR family response regulator
MGKIKILIFSDLLTSPSLLESSLEKLGYSVIKSVNDYREAVRIYYAADPDLVLLDISKERIQNGIRIAEHISGDHRSAKPIIFLTSQKDRELFEKVKHVCPSAYLLKPFDQLSLQHSIELALHRFATEISSPSSGICNSLNNNPEHLFVKKDKKIIKVPTQNILVVEVESKYCTLFSKKGKFILRISLKELMELLPSKDFLRIHRNFLVNINEILEVDLSNNTVCVGDRVLPISRIYRKNIANKFLVLS